MIEHLALLPDHAGYLRILASAAQLPLADQVGIAFTDLGLGQQRVEVGKRPVHQNPSPSSERRNTSSALSSPV